MLERVVQHDSSANSEEAPLEHRRRSTHNSSSADVRAAYLDKPQRSALGESESVLYLSSLRNHLTKHQHSGLPLLATALVGHDPLGTFPAGSEGVDSGGAPRSTPFEAYLAHMARKPQFEEVIGHTQAFFSRMSLEIGKQLPDPQVLPMEDGSLSLAFDVDNFHFTVDIHRNGRFDWLWRDRATEQYGGDEDVPLADLPQDLVRRFAEVLNKLQ